MKTVRYNNTEYKAQQAAKLMHALSCDTQGRVELTVHGVDSARPNWHCKTQRGAGYGYSAWEAVASAALAVSAYYGEA